MTHSEKALKTALEHFPKHIGLGLRPAYYDLLQALGLPQKRLPPVFHVAGTNGKGSTCAFLRAILEASGATVHVYTSPHLVHYNERIRLAGKPIENDYFASLLNDCADVAAADSITVFEAITAAALKAFADHPADYCILEVGLGGRLDATNVVERPLASLITRLSYDHRQHLGNSLAEIAAEKAGIMRAGIPCFAAPQPDAEAVTALRQAADRKGTPLYLGHEAWRLDINNHGFGFTDAQHHYNLPRPNLAGSHQYMNAGLAIAALGLVPQITEPIMAQGLRQVEWPARLQHLKQGLLADMLPPSYELWLDGGHNDSAGEVLAAQANVWAQTDGAIPKPLHLIVGMLSTKTAEEFLGPLARHIASLQAVAIPDEELSYSAEALATAARQVNISDVTACPSIQQALLNLRQQQHPPVRVLIAGSLYLAGEVLRHNKSM